MQFMNSGAAMTSAVSAGRCNAAGRASWALIAAHLTGVPFQIIAPASVYVSDKPSELLVVRKDSPIRTAPTSTVKRSRRRRPRSVLDYDDRLGR